jgi:MinD-like ATPase involved in chromosome partitioning or flagellar assembly
MWHIYRDEVARLSKGTLKSPLELINILVQENSEQGKILEDVIGSLRFRLILNKFRNHVDHSLGEQLVDICNRHLYPNFYLLGNISYDSGVYESIVARNIFIKKYPYTRTASDLQNVAEYLTEEGQEPCQLRVSR